MVTHMKSFLPALALGSALLAPMGLAQEVMQLSMKRAVDIALTPEGSARVALAEQSVRVAETQVTEARGGLLPKLDGSITERRQTINLRTFGFSFDIPIAGFSIPAIVG